MNRCSWCLKGNEKIYMDYHDIEWGVPQYDDDKLFELLVLDGFQAGLSWLTILKKRENFRKALEGFNAAKIAKYGSAEISRLVQNKGIVRNHLKIEAVPTNAQAFLNIKKLHGSFARFIWGFTNQKQIVNQFNLISELPVSTPISEKMSWELKKAGFKFTGPTICYAFMQAAGMVDDHLLSCWKRTK